MTEYNAFWDGTTTGKAGPYSSAQFAAFVMDLLATAASGRANAGVITGRGNGTDDPLDVQETAPASKNVLVKEGSAFVPRLATATAAKGINWYYTDADITVAIPDNSDGSGFDRIDLLVLRLNTTTQTITPTLIEGTPAGVPVAPSPVRSGAIYDIILAEVTAQNLFTTIVNADIDNTVRNHVPVWEPLNGGTGLEGISVGQFFVGGDTTNQGVATPSVTVSHHRLISDTAQDGNWGVVDGRITEIFVSSVGTAAAMATPIIIDDAVDPAGNLTGAIASNQIPLSAGTYEILGGAIM